MMKRYLCRINILFWYIWEDLIHIIYCYRSIFDFNLLRHWLFSAFSPWLHCVRLVVHFRQSAFLQPIVWTVVWCGLPYAGMSHDSLQSNQLLHCVLSPRAHQAHGNILCFTYTHSTGLKFRYLCLRVPGWISQPVCGSICVVEGDKDDTFFYL